MFLIYNNNHCLLNNNQIPIIFYIAHIPDSDDFFLYANFKNTYVYYLCYSNDNKNFYLDPKPNISFSYTYQFGRKNIRPNDTDTVIQKIDDNAITNNLPQKLPTNILYVYPVSSSNNPSLLHSPK